MQIPEMVKSILEIVQNDFHISPDDDIVADENMIEVHEVGRCVRLSDLPPSLNQSMIS